MNILKTLIQNLAAVLFLLGLTLVNLAVYLRFDYVIGLIATGSTLIVVALIYQFEKSQQ